MLVEDNPGDVRLIVEAFKENKLRNKLDVVEDDVEAMAFLYITKPIGLEQFIKMVKTIEDFWLTIVKLPPKAVRDER